MSITIRSAQIIRNRLGLQGNTIFELDGLMAMDQSGSADKLKKL